MDLIYKNEKKLLTIAAIFSGIVWLALTIGTLGIFLIYMLLVLVFIIVAHAGFISHLKGNGVKITEQQYPDLHQRLVRCCERVGQKEIPEAYILRTDFFNALATRFLGRNFIVLFSDVVDALQDQPGAIDFYIGHEVGHIHRKHLIWMSVLWPAMILPLLGAALRRAEEYTCDRYGTACCESEADVIAALAAISAGDTRWKSINTEAYIAQRAETTGFWMSFHELTGDYPWMTKRMATALAMHRNTSVEHPSRSKLAWFLACFVPRTGMGGGAGSLLVIVAIIGILAAVAIPAYQDYTVRAALNSDYAEAQEAKNAVEQFALANNEWPATLSAAGFSEDSLSLSSGHTLTLYENGMLGIEVGYSAGGDAQYLVLEPSNETGEITWLCYGQGVNEAALPSECR